MKTKTKATLEKFSNMKYSLLAGGVIVGAVSGLLVSLFRMVLQQAEQFRNTLLENADGMFITIIFAYIAAFVVVSACCTKVPLCSGSGIPQVKGELRGQIEQNPLAIIIAKFAGGVATIGAGLSLGREGPSVQLGAMTGKGCARLTGKLGIEEKMMMTCGAAAGLSGAFCAPLAGTVFALEELHKNFSTGVMVSTMAASIAADFVASYIFGLSPVFDLPKSMRMPLSAYWQIICLGLVLGVFGVFYNKCTDMFQNLYAKLDRFPASKTLKVLVPFVFAGIFAAVYPLVLGSGHPLAARIARGEFVLKALVVLLIIKFLFSMISFASGVPGGIFLPLLVLGSIIGGIFGGVMNELGFGEQYTVNFVILGMTGAFTAIVRSPVTGVILITEMTGEFTNFMPLAIVALVSFVTADLLGGIPIYDQLLTRMLAGKEEISDEARHKRKLLIESQVYMGSLMDGGKVSKMLLPKGCLIVSVQRDGKEFVPDGDTVLRGGDELIILCAEGYVATVEDKLEKICKSIVG